MKILLSSLALMAVSTSLLAAEPPADMAYKLKQSVVKVHVATKNGGHGVGTGVVVAKDHIVTNCHVLADSNGVTVTKYGNNFAPVAVRADWKHDLCLLRFEYLEIPFVALGDSENLQYEQSVFSIGFPGGPPKPQTTWGKIKALYPHDDSQIVRTSASFVMGASGSPVFNDAGQLIAISTFKSPGREAFYYNVPVKWVKALYDLPEAKLVNQDASPFWDAPLETRPYFMQVVQPLQNSNWPALGDIAKKWLNKEPGSIEALFYQSIAYARLGQKLEAKTGFEQVLRANQRHTGALFELALMANQNNDTAAFNQLNTALKSIDEDLIDELNYYMSLQITARTAQVPNS